MPTYICLVACRDLKNDDGTSAKVSIIRADSGEEQDIGHTKELMGDTPVFEKVFEFDCSNTADDLLKVTILDENDQSRGVAVFNLDKIFQHPKKLGFMEMSADRGAVVVHVVEKINKGTLKLKLKAQELKNTEGFTRLRKPDPFYVLSKLAGRSGSQDKWTKVFTSETIWNDFDPEWKESEISVWDLCDGDCDKTLRLQVFDKERGDSHVIIGSLETTVNDLVAITGGNLPIEEQSEATGTVIVEKAELEGLANSEADSKEFMKLVAVALQNRSDANEKAEAIEKLKEEAAAAKEAAEAARLVAEEKAQALADAEGGLSEAVAAAEAAEADIGGLA